MNEVVEVLVRKLQSGILFLLSTFRYRQIFIFKVLSGKLKLRGVQEENEKLACILGKMKAFIILFLFLGYSKNNSSINFLLYTLGVYAF